MKRRDVLKALATGAVVAVIPKGVEAEGKAQEEAKESQPPRCKICGKTREEEQLVCFINPFRPSDAAEMAWCCRHGHFSAWITDITTGVPIKMTGPVWVAPTVALFPEDREKYNECTGSAKAIRRRLGLVRRRRDWKKNNVIALYHAGSLHLEKGQQAMAKMIDDK